MGYTGCLTEARPNSADANKDKKAEIQSVRLEGLDKELPLEYLMDDTVIKIDFSGDAIEPGESGKTEDAFYGFLSEVYRTYTNTIVHSEDILKILRSYSDSKELNDLIAFYFKENDS